MHKVTENPLKNRAEGDMSLVVMSCLLVTMYLTANIMAVKLISIGDISLFDAGTITFPVTYVLGDALTEIWGFKTARKVILLSFVCNILLVVFTAIGVVLPYPQEVEVNASAYKTVFTYVPRIVAASLIAFL